MNKPTDKDTRGAPNRVRPGLLIASAAVVLLLAAVMTVLRHRGGSDTLKNESVEGQVAPVTGLEPGSVASAGSTAPHSATVPGSSSTRTKSIAAGVKEGSSAEIAKLISALNDPSASMEDRKKAIKALALNGSPEAIAALKQALAGGSNELRAAVAKGLGECDSPECTKILAGLLNDPAIEIARAAIQGLAQQGSPQSVDLLTKLLNDPSRLAELRMDAAEGLGSIKQPGVLEALSNAAFTIQDDDIVTQVLKALGTRDFSETKDFFNNYLHSPSVSSEMRVAAVEALSQAQGTPTEFLLGLASDGDPDVRVAAAWAMSATEETGKFGAQLVSLLQGESDPDVRLRLYQALSNQEGYDVSSVLNAVRNEKDPAALVAGLDLLAKTLRENPTSDLQAFFDQTGYAQLKDAALSGKNSSDRARAVIALVRANSPGAFSALQDLSQQANDPSIRQSAASAIAGFAHK